MTTLAGRRFFTDRGLRAERHREALQGYLCILPWMIGFLVFVFIPIFASLYWSMTHYRLGGVPTYIGFDNYTRAATNDPRFWSSLWRTVLWMFYTVPLGIVGSMIAAILLNQNLKGITAYRTCFFLPSLTPVVAASILWRWILHGDIGVLNWLLSLVGINGPAWLGSTRWAMPSLAMIALWNSIGGGRMLIFLAALQAVPNELYEAADIDGAGTLRKHLTITVPLITAAIFFNMIMGVLGSFQAFALAFLTTDGGPVFATYLFALHIYYTAFGFLDMGYACALSWVLFGIVIVLTAIQFATSDRWVYYESRR